MSSTPIYDELAATYLADTTPEPGRPAGAEQAGGHADGQAAGPPDRQASPPATPSPARSRPRTRPEV